MGYYRLLAQRESLTPLSLAEASGTAPRYAREWLEQQAVTGLLEVTGPGQEPDARRYRLRPGVAEVLADPDQLTTSTSPPPLTSARMIWSPRSSACMTCRTR